MWWELDAKGGVHERHDDGQIDELVRITGDIRLAFEDSRCE